MTSKYPWILTYYRQGLYTDENMALFISKKMITQEDFDKVKAEMNPIQNNETPSE